MIRDHAHHLTMRQGAERLCLGAILQDLVGILQASPDRLILLRQFIQFADDLCRWNLVRVDPVVVADFKQLMIDFYMRLRPEDFRLLAAWRPDQAEEIVAFLLHERC